MMVLSVWVENFSLGSKVKPRMVRLEVVGMGVLLIWMFSDLLYSEVEVHENLCGFGRVDL